MTIDRVKSGKVRRYFVNGERISVGALGEMLFGTMEPEAAIKAWKTLIEKGSIVIERKGKSNDAPVICPTCQQEVLPF